MQGKITQNKVFIFPHFRLAKIFKKNFINFKLR